MIEGLGEIEGGSECAMGCIVEENLDNRSHDDATVSDATEKKTIGFTCTPSVYFTYFLALSFLQR